MRVAEGGMYGLGLPLIPGSEGGADDAMMRQDVFGLGLPLVPGAEGGSDDAMMRQDVFGLGSLGQTVETANALTVVGALAAIFAGAMLAQIAASLGSRIVPYDLRVRR